MIYWIYTVVIRFIVTYAATTRWPRDKQKNCQAVFSKLQRMACLGITEAMRTTLRAATEVFLGLPSYTCKWKWRLIQEIIHYFALINVKPNLKVLYIHTWLRT
jgi:hypothetical protein